MRIAVTGATGFVGRYIVSHLAAAGHQLICWRRPSSDVSGLPREVVWIEGGLGDDHSARELVEGADALVHAALDHPGGGFRGGEGDLVEFVEQNVLGSIRLFERAREAKVGRVVFVSSCAVHDVILTDRPLDEAHPTWSSNHYGAHKAAVEAFVGSYGLGGSLTVCALRPCGVYGLAQPATASKWFGLVRNIVARRPVECRKGGKEVHAADVARGVDVLLKADDSAVSGRMFNCCDRYVSEYEVALLAQRISGADGPIEGEITRPRNQIATDRIRALGMTFGGDGLLEKTVADLVAAARETGG